MEWVEPYSRWQAEGYRQNSKTIWYNFLLCVFIANFHKLLLSLTLIDMSGKAFRLWHKNIRNKVANGLWLVANINLVANRQENWIILPSFFFSLLLLPTWRKLQSKVIDRSTKQFRAWKSAILQPVARKAIQVIQNSPCLIFCYYWGRIVVLGSLQKPKWGKHIADRYDHFIFKRAPI